jgi:hypothetical protein
MLGVRQRADSSLIHLPAGMPCPTSIVRLSWVKLSISMKRTYAAAAVEERHLQAKRSILQTETELTRYETTYETSAPNNVVDCLPPFRPRCLSTSGELAQSRC